MIFPFLRVLLCLLVTLTATLATTVPVSPTIGTNPPQAMPVVPPIALPVTQSRLVVPAFLDAVTFSYRADGENHKVIVTSAPTLLRVDESTDGYSILFDPATEQYTGLEHRNYTWWEFSWPEVSAAVQKSKRYEARLQQLGSDGLNADTTSTAASDVLDPNTPLPKITAPAAAAPIASSTSDDDDSGYVWRPTTDRKRVADLDCVRWTGDTLSGEHLDAWCCAGVLPKVNAAVQHLRLVNEPIALTAVRTITPDTIFPVYSALTKAGVTPLLITWGEGEEKGEFRLLDIKRVAGTINEFTVPKLYVKTTLITMDGMIPSQPVVPPRDSGSHKSWQNP